MKHYSIILLKGAIKPALLTAIISLVIVTFLGGVKSFQAGVLASFIVILFFLIHLILAKITTYLDPRMTFVIMIHSYFLKVIAILLFLVLARNLEVDRLAFAAVALTVTIAWLGGEVKAYWKLGEVNGGKG